MTAPARADALITAVTQFPRHWYAVVDGAHFPDLPALLKLRRLEACPLYLEAADGAGVAAGPHLVALPTRDEVRVLLETLEGRPAATFWSWPGNFGGLRHHLRGLTLVEIPNERRTGPGDLAYETVLFRHWDPNVLAVTLPILTVEQHRRFYGNAAGLIFRVHESCGVTSGRRPEALSTKQRGMLRFEAEQIREITAQRVAASHDKIAKYLREVAPQRTGGMEDSALRAEIGRCDRHARELGLTSERDIGRWAFLELLAGYDAESGNALRAMFGIEGGGSPSHRLDLLFRSLETQAARVP